MTLQIHEARLRPEKFQEFSYQSEHVVYVCVYVEAGVLSHHTSFQRFGFVICNLCSIIIIYVCGAFSELCVNSYSKSVASYRSIWIISKASIWSDSWITITALSWIQWFSKETIIGNWTLNRLEIVNISIWHFRLLSESKSEISTSIVKLERRKSTVWKVKSYHFHPIRVMRL